MQIAQQILFILISVVSIWFFSKKVREISRNIKLGRDEDLNDNKGRRWKNLLLLAFGQKKMFRNPLVAVMHFFVYAGFIIINIEVTHRYLSPYITGGFFYFFFILLLSL